PGRIAGRRRFGPVRHRLYRRQSQDRRARPATTRKTVTFLWWFRADRSKAAGASTPSALRHARVARRHAKVGGRCGAGVDLARVAPGAGEWAGRYVRPVDSLSHGYLG